jgi:glycosyltransferase involved in cell wall biosynthesis
LAKPIMMSVGRVAVEKNLDEFLKLDRPGTKVVVGGGPQLESFKRRYPDVVFAGPKHGEELACHYADADVFAFPSRTDTFGLVMLEALASGVPVAAFPVQGPVDLLKNTAVGALDEDLGVAIDRALMLDREACRSFGEARSWQRCSEQFFANLAPFAELRQAA